MSSSEDKSSQPDGEFVPGASGWSAKRIRIGRIVLDDVHVASREGAINLSEVMRIAIEKTRRGKNSASRYADPLPPSAPTRMLSEEIADYLADMGRRQLSADTRGKAKRYLGMLLSAGGDVPVSEVAASHIRAYWDWVRWWPHDARKSVRFRGMSDEAILETGRRENVPAPAEGTMVVAHRGSL